MAVSVTPEIAAASRLEARVTKNIARNGAGFWLDVDFAIQAGITILFGASGAGKTTLLDCLAGLQSPDAGRIAASNTVFFDSEARVNVRPERRHVGYLFQSLALFPHMTVADNVGYGLTGLASAERRARIDDILQSFHIGTLAARKPGEVSGGERQRVALARALVINPRLLLLDEPLTALDAVTKARLVHDLREWNQRFKVPILYVTHDRDEVYALAESVLVLENGRIIAQGLPQEVLHRPQLASVAQLAGFENIFDCEIVGEHPDLGTMACRIAGSSVELDVPLTHVDRGQLLRVGVRAGDILVATSRPEGLSARNIFSGTIKSLEQRDAAVNALIDCGPLFRVQLTPAARHSLSLEPGKRIWLVIKTYSCHVLQ